MSADGSGSALIPPTRLLGCQPTVQAPPCIPPTRLLGCQLIVQTPRCIPHTRLLGCQPTVQAPPCFLPTHLLGCQVTTQHPCPTMICPVETIACAVTHFCPPPGTHHSDFTRRSRAHRIRGGGNRVTGAMPGFYRRLSDAVSGLCPTLPPFCPRPTLDCPLGDAAPATVVQCPSFIDACPTRFNCPTLPPFCPRPTLDCPLGDAALATVVQCPSFIHACRHGLTARRGYRILSDAVPENCPTLDCPLGDAQGFGSEAAAPQPVTMIPLGCPVITRTPVQCPSIIDACPTRQIQFCPTRIIQLCPTRSPAICPSLTFVCPQGRRWCVRRPPACADRYAVRALVICPPSAQILQCPTNIGCPMQNPRLCPVASGNFGCPTVGPCPTIVFDPTIVINPGDSGRKARFWHGSGGGYLAELDAYLPERSGQVMPDASGACLPAELDAHLPEHPSSALPAEHSGAAVSD